MSIIPVILIGSAAAAYVVMRRMDRGRPEGQKLKGWQKVAVMAAVLLAVLIALNPEFAALGLFGDAAFFDVLVLVLSLQLQNVVGQVWRGVVKALSSVVRAVRWVCTPRWGYFGAVWVFSIAVSAVVAVQKFIQRISS